MVKAIRVASAVVAEAVVEVMDEGVAGMSALLLFLLRRVPVQVALLTLLTRVTMCEVMETGVAVPVAEAGRVTTGDLALV